MNVLNTEEPIEIAPAIPEPAITDTRHEYDAEELQNDPLRAARAEATPDDQPADEPDNLPLAEPPMDEPDTLTLAAEPVRNLATYPRRSNCPTLPKPRCPFIQSARYSRRCPTANLSNSLMTFAQTGSFTQS